MKNIRLLFVLILALPLLITSCLDEDNVPDPTLSALKMYLIEADGSETLITEAQVGKTIKIVVETDADICSVWPGGVRNIMKKKGSDVDSLDMFNNPVLLWSSGGAASDNYSDYGLVGARGQKTSKNEVGWYCNYTYKKSGTFDLTVVLTNHAYNGPEYHQVVIDAGKVIVK